MSLDRSILKNAAIALLDALATEHRLKHQPSKANRYVLSAPGGRSLEIMVEKNEESPLNIWILDEIAGALPVSGIKCTPSPKSKLRTTRDGNGKLRYGRHSALEKMDQLGEADLLCLAPETLEQVGRIIDALLHASAKGVP